MRARAGKRGEGANLQELGGNSSKMKVPGGGELIELQVVVARAGWESVWAG